MPRRAHSQDDGLGSWLLRPLGVHSSTPADAPSKCIACMYVTRKATTELLTETGPVLGNSFEYPRNMRAMRNKQGGERSLDATVAVVLTCGMRMIITGTATACRDNCFLLSLLLFVLLFLREIFCHQAQFFVPFRRWRLQFHHDEFLMGEGFDQPKARDWA